MSEYHDPSNIVNPEHADHHIVTPVQYAMVFAALLIGTVLTVVAARVDLGVFNPIIALGIACTKAVIVILFFMHVKYSPRLVWVFVAAGFIWLAIMVDLTLSDYLTRGRIRGVGQSWKHTEAKPSAPAGPEHK